MRPTIHHHLFTFVLLALTMTACLPIPPAWRAASFVQGQTSQLEGSDFRTWQTTLGDGICAASDEHLVQASDVRTEHLGTHSRLEANMLGRNIQAHNITYLSATNANALGFRHTFSFQFRAPRIPVKDQSETYSQNLEGSIQLWDGTNSRRDFIVAFSWVLNPFAKPGTLQTWQADDNQGHWQDAGFLTPDTEWHTAELILEPRQQRAQLRIDGQAMPASFTRTTRPTHWGNQTDARVTIEGSSVWVCEGGQGMPMQGEFKDWRWRWEWTR
jgi:hypothetical protein